MANSNPAPDPSASPSAPLSSCQLNGSTPSASITMLADALRNPALKRRPIELIDEFELRAEKLLSDARRITGGGVFTFSVPVPADQVVFDAKSGTLTVKPSAVVSGLIPTTLGNGNRVVVVRSIRSLGSNPRETPFEGHRVVTKDEEYILAVNVRGGDYLRWPKNFKTMIFQQDPTIGRVKSKRPVVHDVAVLFAGRLQSPYIAQDVTRREPSGEFDHEVTTNITTVILDPECASLVDRTDNRILTPLPLK